MEDVMNYSLHFNGKQGNTMEKKIFNLALNNE